MDFHELAHTHMILWPQGAPPTSPHRHPTPHTASIPLGSVRALRSPPPSLPAAPAGASTLLRLRLARGGPGAQLFSRHPLPFSEGRPTLPLFSPESTSSQFSLPCQDSWPSSQP